MNKRGLLILVLLFASFGCQKPKKSLSPGNVPQEPAAPINEFPIPTHIEKNKCVLILHDQSKDKDYQLGSIYSIMIQNLLGHFPQWNQVVGAIENYHAGDMDQCNPS